MWKLNLQLFAEDEQNPTDVEASSVDATEETEDVEFDESEETQDQTQQTTKKTNNEYAQKRIKARREAEQKLEEEKRKEYLRGVQQANGGKNRFTGRPIVDDEDLAEFEVMLEMEQKGLDPVEDYTEYLKQKRRLEREQELQKTKQEREAQEQSQADLEEFYKKYSQETAQKLFEDKLFLDFADGILAEKPNLTTVYEKYSKIQAYIEQRAEELVSEKLARRQSSSGGLTETNQASIPNFSNMSDEEFRAFQKKLL